MSSLISLRDEIEKLDSTHHLEILKILKKNEVLISENRNGVFLNLNSLGSEIIDLLSVYVNHVKKQEKRLSKDETLKKKYKDVYFNNDNE